MNEAPVNTMGEILPSDEAPPGFGPVPPQHRIVALDVLRGFALLGIFLVNMQSFAMPLGTLFGGPELLAQPWTEQIAWAVIRVFCQSKFIALFSLLFGMGLVVGLLRSEAWGRRFVPLYLRRLGVLALFGLTHALLLWYGDILFLYAALGMALLLLRNLEPKWLLMIGGLMLIIGITLTSGWELLSVWMEQHEARVAGAAADPPPPAVTPTHDPDERRLEWWRAMYHAGLDPYDPVWQRAESEAYQSGPFSEAFAFRAVTFALSLVGAAMSFGWNVGAFFVFGMALMKVEFFHPKRRTLHKWLAMIGLGLGLPLELLSTWMIWQSHHGHIWSYVLGVMLHGAGSVSVCFGYLGLLTLVVSAGRMRWLTSPLAYAGRMALSNYLLQSLIATGIMYWWGLGLFGQVGRPAQMGLVVIIFSLQVLFSVAWLRAFRFGPMEWLWRSLTYAKWQPLRHERLVA